MSKRDFSWQGAMARRSRGGPQYAGLLLFFIAGLMATRGRMMDPDDVSDAVDAYAVTTVEDDEPYVLLTQKGCPVRYKVKRTVGSCHAAS